MHRLAVALVILAMFSFAPPLFGQIRVTPKAAAQGGSKLGEPWADVPEAYRHLPIADWPIPTDLERWKQVDQAKTRATLIQLLGERPARPKNLQVTIDSREEQDGYTVERFHFYNGVDSQVPGILFIPKNRPRPAPVVVVHHGFGTSKEVWCTDPKGPYLGPKLVKRGYVVASIDGYWTGERLGHGPAGKREKERTEQQTTLFKLNLLLGRSIWGMVLRDDQCLLDYIQSRPEVDPQQIAAVGGSMGCTRACWLAAIDDRVKVVVGDGCFLRFTELIGQGNLRHHAINIYLPGFLTHFDTEAVYSLIAPRPLLMLTGDQDVHAPANGVEVLEKKVGAVYKLYSKTEQFRSVLFKDTGHERVAEMDVELNAWLKRYLPVSE